MQQQQQLAQSEQIALQNQKSRLATHVPTSRLETVALPTDRTSAGGGVPEEVQKRWMKHASLVGQEEGENNKYGSLLYLPQRRGINEAIGVIHKQRIPL